MTKGSGARLEYEPLLIEMLAMYPALLTEEPGKVREGWQQVGWLAHGWFLRVYRGIQSLLVLDDASFTEEAAPIRRSIIEHAVALSWLAAEGDGVLPTLAAGQAVTAKRRRNAIATARWTSVDLDEVDKAIESARMAATNPANDDLNQFTKRVERYADVHVMPDWLAASARSHASYESAICYVGIEKETYGLLLQESRDAIWPVPFATSQLLLSLFALREVLDPKPWEEELEGLLKRYREINNRVRVEDGLRPVDWATGDLC